MSKADEGAIMTKAAELDGPAITAVDETPVRIMSTPTAPKPVQHLTTPDGVIVVGDLVRYIGDSERVRLGNPYDLTALTDGYAHLENAFGTVKCRPCHILPANLTI